MDWFSVVMVVASLASSLMASSGGNDSPDLPGYLPPDYGPLNEQSKFSKYQDTTRNKLLSEYYGGKQEDGRTAFGGTKPSDEYRAMQMGALENSEENFGGDLDSYFASRGVTPGDQVAGAQQELGTTYDQKAREINAKAHDIHALTLGSLFGEVSDAGAQSAQLAGMVGQASQAENARRDQSYASAMQQWQIDQNQPNIWGTLGSVLPMLYGAYKGGTGTAATSYTGAAQTYSPGTYMYNNGQYNPTFGVS